MKLRSLLFAVTLLSISHTFAQNVGVGNTSPNSKLDVSGDLALREGTAITVSSGNNIITLPPAKNSVYRLTGATGAFTIDAISAGNDGMTLTLINATGQVMTVRDSASIRTNINADLIGSTTVSSLSLIYNATIGKWIVTGSEGYNTSAANAWNTTGNTGTTAANFMGTTDNNPLYFKTNNTVAGFLPSSTTGNIYFGVSTSIPTYANENVGIGNTTLSVNTTGVANVAIGQSALLQNSTGNANTAIGYSSLEANTFGSNNVGVGINSLLSNRTGSSNVALGFNAIKTDTSGSYNVGLGLSALNNLLIGSKNVAIGDSAGYSELGSNSVFIGPYAGYNETGSNKLYISNSGTANPLIYGDFTNKHLTVNDSLTSKYFEMTNGATANYLLQSDASGNATWVSPSSIAANNIYNSNGTLAGNRTMTMAGDTLDLNGGTLSTNQDALVHGMTVGLGSGISPSNTAVGAGVLKSNTGGNNNTATGYDALTSNTIGGRNTATGSGALYSNTSGGSNTASGYDALYSNISGNSNTANGTSALTANTTGAGNTASGSSALSSNTTGSNNTANGMNALLNTTTGSGNSANGVYALQKNSTGGNNTATGNSALFSNTSGFGNTANGNLALFNDTTGGHNVALGDSAGFSNVTGNANTYVGFAANASAATLSNATAIGANAYAGASNSMVLGAISGVNGATSSTNVGIGTTTPDTTLQVVGKTQTTYLQMTNGAAANYLLQSDASGNATWVNPSTIAAQNIYNTDGTLTGNRTVTDGANNLTFSSSTGNLYFNTTSGVNLTSGGNIAMGNTLTATGGTSVAFGTGNTASGTASFATGWQNNATGTFSTVFGQENTASGYGSFATGTLCAASATFTLASGHNNTASGYASAALGEFTYATGYASMALGENTHAYSYGELTVGLYNTSYSPSSSTAYAATDRVFDVGNGSSGSALSDAMTILKNGNVGIGTASPATPLYVNASATGDIMTLNNTSAANYCRLKMNASSAGAYISFSLNNTQKAFMYTNGTVLNLGTEAGSADMVLYTNAVEKMRITQAGNVGIGTSSPNGTFDVLPSGGNDVILGGGSTTGSELKLTYGGVQHFSIYNSGNNKLTFAQTSVNIAPNQAGTALMTIDGSGNVNVPVLTASSQVYTDASKNLTSTIPTSGALGYWTRNSASAYLYNSTLTDKVGIGTATPPATLAVNGNAVIGTGQTVRSGNGLTVDYTSTTTYAANTDETDAARGLNIVNEGATANEMAVLAMRTNPTGGANNQMFDLKLVNPNNGAANLIYSFGPNDAFADRFTMTSAGAMGFGTTTPQGQLSNTANNIIGSDGNGTNVNSLVWAMSGLSGFVGAFYNGDGAVSNAHGLAVKIAGTASGNKILDLSTGAAQGTAGTVVMDVFGNGYVGIGTAAPTTTLDVNGSTVIRGAGNTNTPATPASVLEIMSGRNSTSALASGQTAADIALQFGGGGFRHFIASRHNAATGVNTNAIDFYLNNSTTSTGSSAPGTGNVEVMSITEQGVGIGTSAPVNELQVEGNQHMDGNPIYFRSGPTDHFDFIRWSTTGTGGASGDRLDVAGYAGVNLGYTSSGTGGTLVNVLTATNGGQVGIGTTAPAYTLDVAGNGRFNNGSGTFVYVGPGGGAYYGDGTNLVTQIPTGGSFFMANYGINGTNVAQATGSMRIGGPGQLTAALNIQSMSTGSDGPIYSDASGNVLKNTACPSGFTQVDVGLTRLCVIYSSTAGSWNASETTCTNLSGSSICYYLQIQKACNLGYYFNNATNTWLADHDGDDTFIATNAVVSNSTNCSNFDEGSGRGSSFPVFCCLEYMKF